MQPRFVFQFIHYTGARCIVTITPNGKTNQINFSFRHHKGFTWQQVHKWFGDWNDWASAISIGYYDVADPPGWILTSDLEAA